MNIKKDDVLGHYHMIFHCHHQPVALQQQALCPFWFRYLIRGCDVHTAVAVQSSKFSKIKYLNIKYSGERCMLEWLYW